MGLFWDLLQQSQISDHSNRADTLEERVADLEIELSHTRKTLHEVLARLEHIIGEDIDGDGQIG